MAKTLVSLVIPCFNEEDNVERTYRAVGDVIAGEQDYDFEFVFTDNHSTDRTFDILKDLAAKDRRVRAIRFSRNFGYQKSIFTGYMNAKGAAAIQIDADLQDPPDLIPQFLRQWEAGNKVAYGVRKTRKTSALLTLMTRGFYWLLDTVSESKMPRNAWEFRLIDRDVIEELRRIHDTDIFLRGRIAEIGFNQVAVLYERRERTAGETKFTLKNLVELSLDAIASHSTAPLRLSIYLGIGMLALSIVGTVGFIFGRLFLGQDWPAGFATIVVLILVLNGFTLLLLGILGEYIGRIHRQLKTDPDVIVEEEI
jgi:dolichol-phosphate mannosyltransferase